MVFEAQSVPLTVNKDGVIRIGETRVRLDTVIVAFNEGHTAEEIVTQYPALKLADVYAVISYYLNHQTEVDQYMQQREAMAAKIRQEIQSQPDYKVFRERLLARYKERTNSV